MTQREQFAQHAETLSAAAEAADGFDRLGLLWRLESTIAAIRFTDTMIAESARV